MKEGNKEWNEEDGINKGWNEAEDGNQQKIERSREWESIKAGTAEGFKEFLNI
ncbi:MAG: hypothetical protein Q4F21_01805 [Lachnospiraceae bacterium]|nr:hypothetical protein [Lachnospiraceae bacterium]